MPGCRKTSSAKAAMMRMPAAPGRRRLGLCQASSSVKRQRRDPSFDFRHHLLVFRLIHPTETAFKFVLGHMLRQILGCRHDLFLADTRAEFLLSLPYRCADH